MKSVLRTVGLGFAALVLTACAGMPSDGVPTTAPAPAGWGTPEPASETHRLDLSPGVVVAFVEGLTPEMSEKVAYVTHVPSGSQAIVDGDGKVVQRHDGRLDGRDRLDAVLNDGDAMARILEGLTNGEDARPQPHTISWVPMVKFRRHPLPEAVVPRRAIHPRRHQRPYEGTPGLGALPGCLPRRRVCGPVVPLSGR